LASADADDPFVRKKLAQMFLAEKNHAEVVKYATLALHIDVLDADTHRLLAEGHRGLKQFDRAVREFGVALELKPGDSELELALAETHLSAGQKDEAKAVLERLLDREPDNTAAQELLKSLAEP
jgi:tetratricopeptide (TPR) repeat protein